jgi:hypothetical protein
MRIGEMKSGGRQIWPPKWSDYGQSVNDEAVFKGVKAIVGTDLFRIDIEYRGIPYLAIMSVEKEICDTLYHILQENVGRQLGAIAELEIEMENEAADSWTHTRLMRKKRLR